MKLIQAASRRGKHLNPIILHVATAAAAVARKQGDVPDA